MSLPILFYILALLHVQYFFQLGDKMGRTGRFSFSKKFKENHGKCLEAYLEFQQLFMKAGRGSYTTFHIDIVS